MKVRLGDYIQEYSVRNRTEEDLPVYSVTNTEGFCTGYFDKEVASKDRSTYKIVPKGYFAYNPSRINVGSVDWQRHEERVIVSPLYVVFSVSDKILPQYLYYFLKSHIAHTYIQAAATGSVRDNLKYSMLEEFPLELRPIEEQEQIVQILDSINKQCVLYHSQLAKHDDLIKARFVEMFGDPKNNINGFPVRPLGKLVTDIIPGWSANGEARQKVGTEKAVLKVSAVTQGYFVPEEHKALPHDMEIKKYIFPHKGDLLFSRANTRELVGATAIIEKDYPDLLLPDKLWRILFTDEINVYYAKYVLSTETIRRDFSAQSTGTSGSMFNVSAEKFRNIHIPVPPISLQIAFESFVHQIDKSKSIIRHTLQKSQLLFDSLMQKYFG